MGRARRWTTTRSSSTRSCSALEQSGSVGGRQRLAAAARRGAYEGPRLVGALPLYVKLHGYGEYIFDWRWAASAERAGLRYYPKLVSHGAVHARDRKARAVGGATRIATRSMRRAVQGVASAREELGASSVHWLFLNDEERDLIVRATPS